MGSGLSELEFLNILFAFSLYPVLHNKRNSPLWRLSFSSLQIVWLVPLFYCNHEEAEVVFVKCLSQTECRETKFLVLFFFSAPGGKDKASSRASHLQPQGKGKLRTTELYFIENPDIFLIMDSLFLSFLFFKILHENMISLHYWGFWCPFKFCAWGKRFILCNSLGSAYVSHQESILWPEEKVHQDSFWIPLSMTWPCTPDSGRLCVEGTLRSAVRAYSLVIWGLKAFIGGRVKGVLFVWFFSWDDLGRGPERRNDEQLSKGFSKRVFLPVLPVFPEEL